MIMKVARLISGGALLLTVIVLGLIVSPREIAWARGNAVPTPDKGQAFAVKPISHVRGTRINIWTAQQGTNAVYVASPTGICTGTPCEDSSIVSFFETGYYKGQGTTPQYVLQQYASFNSVNGAFGTKYGLGNLNDNTWYTFQTLYSQTAQRWEAWRDGQLKWYIPSYVPINFTEGVEVLCGPEGSPNGVYLAVECNNMQYKLTGSNVWNQYNYTTNQIMGNYCVYKPYEFGALGWGPCF